MTNWRGKFDEEFHYIESPSFLNLDLKLENKVKDFISTEMEELINDASKIGSQTVSQLAVNELIPFEQTEPFKRLALLIDKKVEQQLKEKYL